MVTKNKMVFIFFTYNSIEFIKEFLKLLSCENPKFIEKLSLEFTQPALCKQESIYFDTLKDSCSAQNILATLVSGM